MVNGSENQTEWEVVLSGKLTLGGSLSCYGLKFFIYKRNVLN